jgi:acyl-CoA dehydrogenase
LNNINISQVEEFVEKDCIPADSLFQAQLGEGDQRWTTTPAVMESLKEKAKKLGLWNMFLPKNHFTQGAGFSNLEYGLMAELLGKSKVASEVSNSFTTRFMLGALPERMRKWPK